jgi:hypothetical protein
MEQSKIINSSHFDYQGPDIDDQDTFNELPVEFQDLLKQKNGYICYSGAFHMRGCCLEPKWHSLGRYWKGDMALSDLYPNILPDDIPFAENAFGDQIFFRNNSVWYMNGETGNIAYYNLNLQEFLALVEEDPLANLNCPLLEPFLANGGVIKPGQLLHAYPPRISNHPTENLTITPVPQEDQLGSLSQLAAFFAKMNKKKSENILTKIKSLFAAKH